MIFIPKLMVAINIFSCNLKSHKSKTKLIKRVVLMNQKPINESKIIPLGDHQYSSLPWSKLPKGGNYKLWWVKNSWY